jgi:integrase
MACIRKRRDVWVLDYRDGNGTRRTPSFRTRAEAEDHADRVGAFARCRHRVPTVDPQITIAAYATRWLGQLKPLLKRAAYEAHAVAVAHYVAPQLGRRRVVDLSRGEVINFLTGCRERGVSGRPLTPGSVRVIYSALRAMLNAAVDDELVVGNVAARLGRKFRLQPTKQERQAAVEQRVLDQDERQRLLDATRRDAPAWYPLLLTYDRAGLRLGEGLALEPEDIRFVAGKINIRQALDERTGTLGTPKHGPRLVDLAPGLADVLAAHIAGLKRAALERGQPLGRWLLPSRAGTPLEARNVRRALARIARRAGLGHVTPHDLRHTFGSTLATEELPQYVQQQMGHASVQITIDTYGSAFRAKPRTGVAMLDRGMPAAAGGRRSGSKVVATEARRAGGRAQVAGKTSEPSRDRTGDPLLKRQLLYRLS